MTATQKIPRHHVRQEARADAGLLRRAVGARHRGGRLRGVVAGGYAAVGSLLAQPDMGQSNMRDYADHYARVCAAVNIPVYVDADTGFGGVNNVRQMVRAFEDAGVAGLFISDQVFPNRCGYLPGKQVISDRADAGQDEGRARRAPRSATCSSPRAPTPPASTSVEDAIERCQLFMEAGGDMAKPMGVDTIPEIKRAMREIPGPHMATLSQAAGPKARSLEELEAAGVVRGDVPVAAAVRGGKGGARRDADAEGRRIADGVQRPGAHARGVL